MTNYGLQILGLAETNWNGLGSFGTDGNHHVIFGKEDGYSHGVAVILGKKHLKL